MSKIKLFLILSYLIIIMSGMLVYSSFLISVCMFIVSKALLILSGTVIVHARGAIWLIPFAHCRVLCFVPVLRECVCCYVRKRALLQCLCKSHIWKKFNLFIL